MPINYHQRSNVSQHGVAAILSGRKTEEFTDMTALEVARIIEQETRKLQEQFPVGCYVILPEQDEPVCITQYVAAEGSVTFYYRTQDGKAANRRITKLSGAIRQEKLGINQQIAAWQNIRDTVSARTRTMLTQAADERPIDITRAETRVAARAMRYISKLSSPHRADPPSDPEILIDDSIRRAVSEVLKINI